MRCRMYSIQVQREPKSKESVLASIPFHCLIQSGFYEQLSVDVDIDNRIIGLDYSTSCLDSVRIFIPL